MLNIINIMNCCKWDAIVSSFPNYDVYYLSGYVKAFQIHGDGDPELLFYEGEGLRAVYVYMKRKIETDLYDSVTPYGYGGVLFDGDASDENLQRFQVEYENQMRYSHIVCNFVRYHPVLANAIPMKSITQVIDLGKTIAMDLSSSAVIWDNIHSKNRNMIRKAEKNGIEIRHGKGMELLDAFITMYNGTMDRDNAESYYYFKRPFYESIHNDLNNNYEVFYAVFDGKIISMAIMIFAN